MSKNAQKHIVIGGCSFTQHERLETWHHSVKRDFSENTRLHSSGIGGAGNYVISTMCINKVSELLKSGASPEDILVITQWSGVSRKSFIGDSRPSVLSVAFHQCESENEIKSLASKNGSSKFCWDIGKKNNIGYWTNYKDNYWSDEAAFIETLENILRTQWFLKSSNIKFLMFLGWDLFTNSDTGSHMHTSPRGWFKANDSRGQWDKNTPYRNKENDLLKDLYPWSAHLWNMIDFSHFTFFENESVKLGGMIQWGQYNLDSKKWYCGDSDPHPSRYVQDGFYLNHVKPWVEDNIKDDS
jgi:hypothetical protein